jgi:uncharacterized repeat protein (TIGR03803 family)
MTVEKLTYMLAIAEQLALPPKRRTKLSHVGKLGGLGSVCALFLFCAATTIASPAQVLTTLVNFNYSNGAEPQLMSLIQATDGNLYGTTSLGGPIGSHGTIFKMTAAGVLTTLANLSDADGILPTAGVVQGTDGNFYGTTEESGAHIFGTVFKMTRRGTLTPLYSFCAKKGCRDGGQPDAALIQGKDGNLYGTTQGGGANDQGTVFKITLAGALTTLYSFCSQIDCVDGSQPSAELVQGSDGNFYGTTYNGGSGPSFGGCFNGCGTVFKITSEGKLTTLHNFDGADGNSLLAGLIQATDGNFYGTTEGGGTNGQGTVFKTTPGGVLNDSAQLRWR